MVRVRSEVVEWQLEKLNITSPIYDSVVYELRNELGTLTIAIYPVKESSQVWYR